MSASAAPRSEPDADAATAEPASAARTVATARAVDEPGSAANEPRAAGVASDDAPDNLVKRTIEEISALLHDVHEIREELLARGVHFHMLNALIELGVQNKPEELAKMADTAVEASVKAHGSQAISRETFDERLDELVTLEKSLRHARQIASKQGVHMQALHHLTQLIRVNPGDGGVQAINTFVAYADAAGVPLDRAAALRAEIADEAASVLPNIPRDEPVAGGRALRAWLTDLAVGLSLTVGVMWLVL